MAARRRRKGGCGRRLAPPRPSPPAQVLSPTSEYKARYRFIRPACTGYDDGRVENVQAWQRRAPSQGRRRCHWGKAPDKRSGKCDFRWATTSDCVIKDGCGRRLAAPRPSPPGRVMSPASSVDLQTVACETGYAAACCNTFEECFPTRVQSTDTTQPPPPTDTTHPGRSRGDGQAPRGGAEKPFSKSVQISQPSFADSTRAHPLFRG